MINFKNFLNLYENKKIYPVPRDYMFLTMNTTPYNELVKFTIKDESSIPPDSPWSLKNPNSYNPAISTGSPGIHPKQEQLNHEIFQNLFDPSHTEHSFRNHLNTLLTVAHNLESRFPQDTTKTLGFNKNHIGRVFSQRIADHLLSHNDPKFRYIGRDLNKKIQSSYNLKNNYKNPIQMSKNELSGYFDESLYTSNQEEPPWIDLGQEEFYGGYGAEADVDADY